MHYANVKQHQYAVVKFDKNTTYLATKGIWTCTGWFGVDQKNQVAFLCHFDLPSSANSVPEILQVIKEYVPTDNQFESTLIGGKAWAWSKRTRQRIKDTVNNQTDINISISESPFNNWLFNSIDVSVCLGSGKISYTQVQGETTPKGNLWIFRTMERVLNMDTYSTKKISNNDEYI
jgi:hypothetical protein